MTKNTPQVSRYRPTIRRVSSADPLRFEFISLFDVLRSEPRAQHTLVRHVERFVARRLEGGGR